MTQPFCPFAALAALDPGLAQPQPIEETAETTEPVEFTGFKYLAFDELTADLMHAPIGGGLDVPILDLHPDVMTELGCPSDVSTREGYRDYLIQLHFPPEVIIEAVSAAFGPRDTVPDQASPDGGINPKDALGVLKPDLSVIPPAAQLHLASAMMDGAVKYGPFNWRGNAVLSRVYVAAAMRHLLQFLDGEDFDPISGVHHLGHAMACCAIVVDAQETGNLADNRPTPGMAGDMIRRWSPEMKFRG